MLCAFGHPVATCCNMLAVVGSNLKKVIFFMQHFGCCMMLESFGQVRLTMLRPGMRTSSIFNAQHVAKCCNSVAKRVQHVAPNNVAICCDGLAGACKCWANNVGICCVMGSWLRLDFAIVWPGLYKWPWLVRVRLQKVLKTSLLERLLLIIISLS